eukprot:scaffold20284_cov74-Phaeocystis_antarctica.AAC.1
MLFKVASDGRTALNQTRTPGCCRRRTSSRYHRDCGRECPFEVTFRRGERRRRNATSKVDVLWRQGDDITHLFVRRLRATRLKSSKSPKLASITASRCSRSLARKHCALPASKVANCSVSSRRAAVWSSSRCAMRWISTRSWSPPTACTNNV